MLNHAPAHPVLGLAYRLCTSRTHLGCYRVVYPVLILVEVTRVAQTRPVKELYAVYPLFSSLSLKGHIIPKVIAAAVPSEAHPIVQSGQHVVPISCSCVLGAGKRVPPDSEINNTEVAEVLQGFSSDLFCKHRIDPSRPNAEVDWLPTEGTAVHQIFLHKGKLVFTICYEEDAVESGKVLQGRAGYAALNGQRRLRASNSVSG